MLLHGVLVMQRRVVAAVIEDGGSYLVCLRPREKRHGGLWEFPGGKVEENESIHQAVTRELAEELSVVVTWTGDVLFTRSDPGSEFVILFVAAEISGEPIPVEHDQLAWCQPDQLLSLPLAPSDRRFVIEHLTSI
jgi:mutator protein MutT